MVIGGRLRGETHYKMHCWLGISWRPVDAVSDVPISAPLTGRGDEPEQSDVVVTSKEDPKAGGRKQQKAYFLLVAC